MSITINDPELLDKLRNAEAALEFVDPDGRALGTFAATEFGRLPPGVVSPFTEAEMAERRKNRTGRPLAEVLRDLQARG